MYVRISTKSYVSSVFLDFPKNPKKYQSTLFIIKITDWPVDSPFASGYVQHVMVVACVTVALVYSYKL